MATMYYITKNGRDVAHVLTLERDGLVYNPDGIERDDLLKGAASMTAQEIADAFGAGCVAETNPGREWDENDALQLFWSREDYIASKEA